MVTSTRAARLAGVHGGSLEPIGQILLGGISALLQKTPASPAKIAFAWRVAVGGPLARATTVGFLDNGTLAIRVAEENWQREVRRATPLILDRLNAMLGPGTVTRLALRSGRSVQTPAGRS